jgi:hypothetical protein
VRSSGWISAVATVSRCSSRAIGRVPVIVIGPAEIVQARAIARVEIVSPIARAAIVRAQATERAVTVREPVTAKAEIGLARAIAARSSGPAAAATAV